MPLARRLAALLPLLTLSATPAAARQAADSLTRAQRAAIVDSVSSLLERRYVDSTAARRIGERLRAQLRAGAYDAMTSAATLGAALMQDLQRVAPDKHLRLTYEPGREYGMAGPPLGPGTGARAAGGAEPVRVRMPILRSAPPAAPAAATGSAPAGAAGPSAGPRGPMMRIDGRDPATIARTNFAFERVERLDGNVGYLKLGAFVPPDLSRDTWLAALAFLAHVDALIVDVRDNYGGAPEGMQLLLSRFTERPTLLMASYNRAANILDERWTEPELPGPRFAGRPLFVLQNRNSASTAEMLGYVVQQHRLGTVVGDTSAGAGNGGTKLSVGAGLALFIPQFRIVTGPGYERTGVIPDVWTRSDDALRTAHRLAVRALAREAAAPDVARERAWALEWIEAQERPAVADVASLRRFVGRFGGRRFELRDGALVHVGASGTVSTLTPVGRDVFRTPTLRFRFEGDGPSAVTIEQLDGPPLHDVRSPAS